MKKLKISIENFYRNSAQKRRPATDRKRSSQANREFLVKKEDPVSKKQENQQTFAGESIKQIAARIPKIASSAITSVYIEGESGTGKEVIADLFAAHNPLIPFIRVNCGGIAPNLLESELFGHAKGAFTGALSDKIGLLEAASGGWLFLDEVSSLSKNAQIALLRAIENQEITRIGETRTRKIKTRFIAAANVSLQSCVQNHLFRNDLWQRLRESEIILKPLRERKNEIPEFIFFFCHTMPGGPYRITDDAFAALCKHSWQDGNIRELRNCLRAMTEHQKEKTLSLEGVSERILSKRKKENTDRTAENTISIPIFANDGSPLSYKQMTKILLQEYLTQRFQNKVNISQTAAELGLARSTLKNKLRSQLSRLSP